MGKKIPFCFEFDTETKIAVFSKVPKQAQIETPKEYKLKRRRDTLRCDICPPHKGDNASRKPRYGTKKPKYKDKRK